MNKVLLSLLSCLVYDFLSSVVRITVLSYWNFNLSLETTAIKKLLLDAEFV